MDAPHSDLETLAILINVARDRPADALAMLDAAALIIAGARQARMSAPVLAIVDARSKQSKRKTPAEKRGGIKKQAREKPSKRARPTQPSTAKQSAPRTEANGVAVDGAVISFKGKSITVARKHAAVVVELARVMPNTLGHDVLARKLWPEASANTGHVCAAQATLALSQVLDAIGLKVTRMRGIGACLAEA